MISTQISRASAALLLLAGLALLFCRGRHPAGTHPWFSCGIGLAGQLLAAAWLAVATLNWLSRSTVLGGIYGRAMVATNAVL